ncbi:hypothetical protein FB45DRAFT_1064654 [Roridomyces roridus]|uniref:Uncharacterized protein n=1 Tax=Roridomyces roridus TaxID=1738132 RepID=A0AAD7B919_9AGAR|nr:hypothetical protein FB45DRAFT_1064654 [Roridomyces roridus]
MSSLNNAIEHNVVAVDWLRYTILALPRHLLRPSYHWNGFAGTAENLVVVLGVTGVSPLVITNPTRIVSGSPITWTWTVDVNDPPLFSIVLENSAEAQAYSGDSDRTVVADIVDATRLRFTVSGVQRKTGSVFGRLLICSERVEFPLPRPHVAFFVNSSDSSHIFATRSVDVGEESGSAAPSLSGAPVESQSSATLASSSTTPQPSRAPSVSSLSSSMTSLPSPSSQMQMHFATHGRGWKLPKSTIVAITFGAVTLCLLTVGITFFLYSRVQRRRRDRDRDQDKLRLDVEASGGNLEAFEVEDKTEGPGMVTDDSAGSEPNRHEQEQVVDQLRAMQRQMEDLQAAVGLGTEQNEVLKERIRVLEAELEAYSHEHGHANEGGSQRPPSYVSE